MRHFYQHIDGWFSYEYIYKDVVAQAKDGSLFVEIGSFKGRSTAFMCVEIANSGKDIKFECIDPLELISHYAESAIDQPEVFTDYNVVKFHERLMPVKEYYTLQQLTSNEAVNLYKDGSIDFFLLNCTTQAERSLIEWDSKMQERSEFIRDTKYTLGTVNSKGYYSGGTATVIDAMLANTKKLYDQYRQVLEDLMKEKGKGRTYGGA